MTRRAPIVRAQFEGELVFDGFAGGGGTSTGLDEALGRPPDFAVNHDPEALAMHEANHPDTRHFCESIWEVDPRELTGGRRVGLAWFSPDCKHFSRAKGGPLHRSKEIRSLAWVVIRWASMPNRPRVIIVENVEEFLTWGPLGPDGVPIADRAGETFAEWMTQLRWCGYEVEVKRLVAADYGSPTTRRRLFIVARCDRQPIVWPEPTHGAGRARPWRAASEVLDWSLPTPSIFGRRRPLAATTLRRVVRGLQRYVLDAASPFLVSYYGTGTALSCDDPLDTVTTRGRFALVAPYLVHQSNDITRPLGTVVAGGVKHGLVAAFLARHYGGNENDGAPVTRPMHTITTQDHHSLVEVALGHDRRAEVRELVGGEASVVIDGRRWEVADIGMRMLSPRELFGAQGFPADYEIAPLHNGKPLTKTTQIRLVGNSVPPQLARSLAAANGSAS